MGRGHLDYPGSVLRAVCDVDRGHLASALEAAGPGVSGYTDFREVLARPDIDIVHIATPPHWHALIAIAAAEAGKDVWCEKPMTRTIAEGRALVDAVRRTGRIFRINTWFRFTDRFYGFGTDVRPVKKVVQNGLLGWPIKATVSATTGFDWKFYWSGLTYAKPEPVPPELDYDFWLGPAPWKPYHPHRVHGTFRGYWDYDGGGLGDMGMHYLDPGPVPPRQGRHGPGRGRRRLPAAAPGRLRQLAAHRIEVRRRLRHRPRRREQGHPRPLSRRAQGQALQGLRVRHPQPAARSWPPCPTRSRR